jgi:hypothetical protein
MERTLKAIVIERDSPAEPPVGDAMSPPPSLQDYLVELGIRDSSLRQSLARDCLAQARKLAGTGNGDELSLRAIEEVQRRLDGALARILGLNPIRDAAKIAGARAALLLCSHGASSDDLFDSADTGDRQERIARLAACLPLATPPEAHQDMPAQPFDFLFFKSS